MFFGVFEYGETWIISVCIDVYICLNGLNLKQTKYYPIYINN